jgi:hypothetical protein
MFTYTGVMNNAKAGIFSVFGKTIHRYLGVIVSVILLYISISGFSTPFQSIPLLACGILFLILYFQKIPSLNIYGDFDFTSYSKFVSTDQAKKTCSNESSRDDSKDFSLGDMIMRLFDSTRSMFSDVFSVNFGSIDPANLEAVNKKEKGGKILMTPEEQSQYEQNLNNNINK